jgi:hypothetical protein
LNLMPSVSVNQTGRTTTVNSSNGAAVVKAQGGANVALAATGFQGAPGPVGGITDGDKGDVIVGNNGQTLTLDDVDGGTFN